MAYKAKAIEEKKNYPFKIAEVIKLCKENNWDSSEETKQKIIQTLKEKGIEKKPNKAKEMLEQVYEFSVASGNPEAIEAFGMEIVANLRSGLWSTNGTDPDNHIKYIKESMKFIGKGEAKVQPAGTVVHNNTIKISQTNNNNNKGPVLIEAGHADLVKAIRAANNQIPIIESKVVDGREIRDSEPCVPVSEHSDTCEDP